ncbi:MAG TPA: gluconate transporter, partial [Cytophagales bacterium]|nr:gluconate transporter [Cytophagales bacterium]
GIIAGIPAIFAAKFLLRKTMQRIKPVPLAEYAEEKENPYQVPSLATGLIIALLPVLLIGGSSLLAMAVGENEWLEALGNPAIAMLLSVLASIYFLGIRTGRKMTEVMKTVSSAISGVAGVLLIIAGAGAFKEIMIATEVSDEIGMALGSLGMSPFLMAWLIAAMIRVCVGSATVAALTAAGIMIPIATSGTVSPELLVLATGAGSITFSHVNDGGFWLFKEYFNVSIRETLLSWTVMETTVSLVGLGTVLVLDLMF